MKNKKININMLVIMALMVAMHIILSRFLSFNAWNMKIGFAFLPIFLTGYIGGVIPAVLVGVMADLIGASLFPSGQFFFGFTLNAIIIGIIMGLCLHKKQDLKRIILASWLEQLGVSLWITPIWLSILYGAPYRALIYSRIPQIALMAVVEPLMIYLFFKAVEKVNLKNTVTEVDRDTLDPKRNLRKVVIEKRESLSPEERKAKSENICRKLIDGEDFKGAKKILLYKAIKSEVDLSYLEAEIRKMEDFRDKKVIAYPLVKSANEMIALAPNTEEDFVEGFHNILEPKADASEKVEAADFDIIVCPCTAFDEEGNRMGMGAGYYDRYLAQCGNAKIVAVAFECQKVATVFPEAWDKRMNAVYTEEQVYRFLN